MFSRLFSRLNGSRFDRSQSPVQRAIATSFEGLENRLLLTAAPKVLSLVADNRGEVVITLSRTVTGVSKSSVKLFTPGANGAIGDADDVRQPSQVVYTPANNRITIKGKLAAGTNYRVRVDAKLVKSTDGRNLDGEFTGAFASGDGKPGGNFAFVAKKDKSATPTVRMSTSEGVISIKMDANTPKSVINFLTYANSGRYDSSFITRNVPGFIIQGGSLVVNSSDAIVETTVDAPVVNEFKAGITQNTRGRIAFAKSAGSPDSATNQFFFNLADNRGTSPNGLDFQNGGFTTFGTITNASGLAVMDAIAGKQVVALKNPLPPGDGVGPDTAATGLTDTPVNTPGALTGTTETVDQFGTQRFVVTGGFDAKTQLILIRRVAPLDKVSALA